MKIARKQQRETIMVQLSDGSQQISKMQAMHLKKIVSGDKRHLFNFVWNKKSFTFSCTIDQWNRLISVFLILRPKELVMKLFKSLPGYQVRRQRSMKS